LARELFTDANQYVIRMGPALAQQGEEVSNPSPEQQQKMQTIHTPTTTTSIVPTYDALNIVGLLSLDKKAITLAAAVAVDFDYFSHTSGRPGIMSMLPLPLPMPAPAPVEAGPTEGVTEGAVASEAVAGEHEYSQSQETQQEQPDQGWTWNDEGDDDGGDGDGFSIGDLFDSD
jgi:hypothetical protein